MAEAATQLDRATVSGHSAPPPRADLAWKALATARRARRQQWWLKIDGSKLMPLVSPAWFADWIFVRFGLFFFFFLRSSILVFGM